MNKLLYVLLLLFVYTISVEAQVTDEQVRAELEKRGLEEDEVRVKLLERGIDIDAIDPGNPAQVIMVEKALQEIVAEMEAEKKKIAAEQTEKNLEDQAEEKVQEEIKEVAKESADDIKDAIDEGATIEEALAEELADSQSEELPPAKVYGQEVFRNKSIRLFRSSEDIKPKGSYVLGVGDKLTVSIWGYSEETIPFTINDDGYIKPPKMPRIYLKGMTYDKAKSILYSRFSQYYRFRPQEFEVTLNFARTITVHIVGEVFNYGSFTIPAINTAYNALIAAGGPSDIGSVRNISLKRSGQKSKNIDLYKFLLDPSAEDSLYLLENDYIHVPVAEKLVTIRGAVKRPFKYELLKTENLKSLIFYAAGLTESAYKGKIQIKRFINDEEVIIDVDLNEIEKSGSDFQLYSGDDVTIAKIPKPYKNFVTVKGSVELPGKFEVTNGMKLSDLLKKAVLSERALTEIAFLQRRDDDNRLKYIKVNLQEALDNPRSGFNILLQPKDKLVVYSRERYVDNQKFTVAGSVREPNTFKFDQNKQLRLSDAIFLAGGLKRDATDFGYIIRKADPTSEKELEYIRVDVKDAVENPNSASNLILEPSDQLKIYSKLSYIDEFFVDVSGAVRSSGRFQFDESLQLKDIITMAGGLKYEAAKNRIDVFRLDIDQDNKTTTIAATLALDEAFNITEGDPDFRLQPFDQIVIRKAPEFELQRGVTITGEVSFPGGYSLIGDNEKVSAILKRSGGITGEAFTRGATLYRAQEGIGYIVLDLDVALKNPKSEQNLILKAGDIINIPKQKDIVTIVGATRASELYPEKLLQQGKINVAFSPGKNAKYYVNKYAAGVGNKGKKRLITVEHPNGKIERTKNFLIFKKYPKVEKGSIVKVGRKPIKEKKVNNKGEEEKTNWGDVLTATITQATSVLTLILLIQRLD